jgi:hypothetical protein
VEPPFTGTTANGKEDATTHIFLNPPSDVSQLLSVHPIDLGPAGTDQERYIYLIGTEREVSHVSKVMSHPQPPALVHNLYC